MNKTMLSIALAAAASAGFAQTPTFTQVARYTLNTGFSFAASNVPGAVAFDGTNAYISTLSSGAAGTTLYKLPNALTPSGQTASVFATQPTAAGNRGTDLAFANGTVYWGYGLGNDVSTAGQVASGIARYNLDGTLSTGFGTNGVLSAYSGVARFDSFAVDPSTGRIGIAAYTRGLIFNADALTGAATGNLSFPTSPDTSWRSIAFDTSGNLYGRNGGGPNVRSWTRSGTTFINQKDLATVGTSTGFPSRLGYVGGNGFDSFLLANNYSSSSTGVSILSASTGTSLGTLTGTENGLGGAFGNSLGVAQPFGFSSSVVGGSTYVFVTGISDAGGADTLAIYKVQAVPEPASLAALGLGALAILRRRRRA